MRPHLPPAPHHRALILAGAVAVLALLAFAVLRQGGEAIHHGTYAQVVQQVQRAPRTVKSLEVQRGDAVTVHYRRADRTALTAAYPDEQSLHDLVVAAQRRQVPVSVADGASGFNPRIILQLAPIALLLVLLALVAQRAAGGSAGGMGGMGNHRFGSGNRFEAKAADSSNVSFADVAGLGESRDEVAEVVDFLKDHDRYTKVGAKVPRGVLFVGPPGTGKTLLAKAVAGESDAAFFSITGSDFVEMFVGLGANRVRKLFENARKHAPSIIFIDEIDAVGRRRNGNGMPGSEEREQTLNQLLSEMDGFDDADAVVVIAATNRPDVLDPALLRPGRFDRQINVDPPDVDGRLAILKVHAASKPIGQEMLHGIARQTPGFTGAELANLLNEAAIIAARRRQDTIDESCLDAAMMRVVAGVESRRPLSDEERARIAYHEVGHALCAHFTEHRTPVQKISVISRGRALGFTLSVPDQERMLETRDSLMDRLVLLLGGRATELIVFGSVSSGASNDLQRATALATQMVTSFGLSERIGPRVVNGADEGQLRCSPATAEAVEEEILALVNEAHERAVVLLQEHNDDLHRVTDALTDRETLEGDEFLALLGDPDPVPEVLPVV